MYTSKAGLGGEISQSDANMNTEEQSSTLLTTATVANL